MPNLATLADLELVLQSQVVGDEAVAAAEFALMSASAAVRNYTAQTISLVVDDNITVAGLGGRLVFLPELPVVSVSLVREDGTLLAVDDDYILDQFGVLFRRGNYLWPYGPRLIEVTYTHGYATIPDDVVAVTARAASRLYQAGLRARETGAVLGIASKSLGDFSVSYAAEGAAEGQMGASGARLLVLSEKDILNKYRL